MNSGYIVFAVVIPIIIFGIWYAFRSGGELDRDY